MYCTSLFADSPVNDAYSDHLCVISNVINRIDNMRTPYLFTTLIVGNKKIYLVRSEFVHLNESLKSSEDKCDFMDDKSGREVSTSFFIRLNPAIRRGLNNGPAGKKTDRLYAIKNSDEIESWFSNKCDSIGIKVTNFEILQKGVAYCSKGQTSINEAYVKVHAYASKEAFMQLYCQGFGKRKGFGFGMPSFSGSKHYEIINSVLVAPFISI